MEPQEQSNYRDVPVSPPMGGMEQDVPQAELSQEEMRANLESLMSKINGSYREFAEKDSISKVELGEQRDLALREIFDLFRSMGIDPSDVQQVKAFLDKIKLSNPELYQQIEKSLADLVGDGQEVQEEPGGEEGWGENIPPEDMDINKNEDFQ